MKRILTRVEGVTDVTADVATGRVVAKGTADKDVLHEKLKKWSEASGKSVALADEAS